MDVLARIVGLDVVNTSGDFLVVSEWLANSTPGTQTNHQTVETAVRPPFHVAKVLMAVEDDIASNVSTTLSIPLNQVNVTLIE